LTTNHPFLAGQRWVSDSEPELGLGSVLRVGPRTVTVAFGATGETRDYALDHAPLRRAQFHGGETLTSLAGQRLVVATVTQRGGLTFYGGQGLELCETELSPTLRFSTPRQRMLAGQFDPPEAFRLRVAALGHQHQRRQDPVRGFLGGRMDLLPHQLAIAAQVTDRLVPRVLLADEVGLGKTIEACLILHRMILTGRARRVLILVPDSLVHQWFLELMRRFNLWFHIFDEERCAALEAEGANPFLDDQLVLCSLALFTARPQRLEQALGAGWDLLVVDEAHHLRWSATGASAEYEAVERLAAGTPGLLLLTATPEQLGVEGHFARLRLLDPGRFHDLQAYARQAEAFGPLALLAEQLSGPEPLPPMALAALAGVLGTTPEAAGAGLAAPGGREATLGRLLDQHGTGRVMFRNTRARIQGFPPRVARLEPLACAPDDPGRHRALAREFEADLEAQDGRAYPASFKDDPRIHWLAGLLTTTPATDKILLICRTRTKAEAIEAALRHHLKVKAAVFHEGLTLVQRDRGAAWFAEPQGARLLICSEIGSEGRNFQFAHTLVLFDLPLDPGLLEQRIGRLDRIGQTSAIQVRVPFVTGSPQEGLARWYHEGLDAFTHNLPGGREVLEQFRPRLLALAASPASAELEALIAETRVAARALGARLEAGRDRLLELNTQGHADEGARLVAAIQEQDADRTLDAFLLATFDHCFIPVEEVAPRTYQLGSVGVLADSFPGLPSEGLTVTCDRQRALVREDLSFLTWDHPLVTGALDLLLGTPQGNCAFARWPDPRISGLYLEAIYLLECLAPAKLHVDRFLPPTPLRVVVDHGGRDLSQVLTPAALARVLGDTGGAQARPEWLEQRLPPMLEQAQALAAGLGPRLVAQARKGMATQLGHERTRLQELRRVNGGVREDEIQALEKQRGALDQHLAGARVRLEALRLIHRGPGRG
jgi:ATP-dependent helicase HepA